MPASTLAVSILTRMIGDEVDLYCEVPKANHLGPRANFKT